MKRILLGIAPEAFAAVTVLLCRLGERAETFFNLCLLSSVGRAAAGIHSALTGIFKKEYALSPRACQGSRGVLTVRSFHRASLRPG